MIDKVTVIVFIQRTHSIVRGLIALNAKVHRLLFCYSKLICVPHVLVCVLNMRLCVLNIWLCILHVEVVVSHDDAHGTSTDHATRRHHVTS